MQYRSVIKSYQAYFTLFIIVRITGFELPDYTAADLSIACEANARQVRVTMAMRQS